MDGGRLMGEGKGAPRGRRGRVPEHTIKIVFRPVEGGTVGCVEPTTSTIIVDPACAPDLLCWTIARGVDILLQESATRRPRLRVIIGGAG